MKKQIMAAFVASLIVISGAQAGIPVAIENALSNGRKR